MGIGQRVSSSLPACATIFTAELTAIRNVLRVIDNNGRDRFTISDSKSVLLAIRKYNNNPPLVIESLTWLVRLHCRHKSGFFFCWVPAHVGVGGNEAVGTLAKRAITQRIIQGAILYYKDYHPTFKKVLSETGL